MGQQICREQTSTRETLWCHHFEHLILYDSHPENITLWTPHTEDSAMCGARLLCLHKALSGTVLCRWGLRLLTCSWRKSPRWDSYLLINKWFMWSTPNKIGIKGVRTAPSNIATKDLETPLGMHHCTKSVLF